jgi:hypothetical protein
MGRSDPFPVRFEIRFGSLNFQATGNGYHMRITNRDELHPWWSTGIGPVPAMPAADAPASAQANNTGPSAPRRRRHSSRRTRQARMERRRAARAAAQRDAPASGTTATPARECEGPCDALGFYLASLTLMTESAKSNLLTLVKPRSTWVITSKTSPTITNDLLDQVYTHLWSKFGQTSSQTLCQPLCL